MDSVSQWPYLRLLGEQLGGAEGLLEAARINKHEQGVYKFGFVTVGIRFHYDHSVCEVTRCCHKINV